MGISSKSEAAYVPYNGNDKNFLSAVKNSTDRGYKVTACSGPIETNNGKITTSHPYAFTSKETGEISSTTTFLEFIICP